MDAITAHENIKINGGNNIHISHGHFPTQCYILKAVSMISNYTDNMNNPIACKMEVILGTLYEAALSW